MENMWVCLTTARHSRTYSSSTGLGQALTSYYFHIKDLSHWQWLTCPKEIPSTLFRACSLPQSLSLFCYLCKNLQSTLFTLLCHLCHLCFTCWGGEKILKTLCALPSPKQPLSVGSLSPAVLKGESEHKFPRNISYFTIKEC